MTRSAIDKEERQSRLLLLQDFEQWRAETGSNSRKDYAQERGIGLQYLINCLKWHHEACKRKDRNVMVANIGPKPKEFDLCGWRQQRHTINESHVLFCMILFFWPYCRLVNIQSK